ncbi:putative efflux ABC transporter, ATP-binding protein [Listeria floridensis FSL S10-1187]|uniref:Efflux ABC transporter, ATP-binding protein n=1 Tax=Listeria floridensis FSL S10-1187 TaxID=1265817 RepID=A0ABP3AWP4_9LIST|nr:ABC transporter ATP-binding protein [Listeria floridensis]EUJ30306.1 putative efflux ABC transporter, ATP-binding protein [Listeria floridensis FSL S10-1187]
MSEWVLEVKNLTKMIKKKRIIEDISFQVGPGEVFGFLGPNGAGKTTTIRMLVGLIRPSSGTILVDGYDIRKNFKKAMQRMGAIVENPEFYPFLTGRENLEYLARMDRSIKPERIREVAKLVRLDKRLDERVSTYSLGMRQRLGIAQALLSEPKLLILDEPTNGLDPAGIHEMRDFIRALAEETGISVLVSSHLLSEIELLADRVAIMTEGKLLVTDEVKHLLGSREQIRWEVEPQIQGREILASFTEVETRGKFLFTEKNPEHSLWNEALVRGQVAVRRMEIVKPSLEELFLELTGGKADHV